MQQSHAYGEVGLSYKNRFSQIQPFSVRIQHSKFNFEYVWQAVQRIYQQKAGPTKYD